MLAYCDETRESMAALLRPGNAGANTASDQIAVAEAALEQIPKSQIETIDVLLRVDCAGVSHELLDWAHSANIRFSVGLDLRENVRAQILEIADQDLSGWPTRSRVIVRRERAHPGAQLSFTDHDGHRFQAILTDQTDADIAMLECRHRARARVEDQIRNDKQTGLSNLPFRDLEHNRVWLKLVALAHDLLTWTQTLLLNGELAKAEPKRLRYRPLHTATRLPAPIALREACPNPRQITRQQPKIVATRRFRQSLPAAAQRDGP